MLGLTLSTAESTLFHAPQNVFILQLEISPIELLAFLTTLKSSDIACEESYVYAQNITYLAPLSVYRSPKFNVETIVLVLAYGRISNTGSLLERTASVNTLIGDTLPV